MRRGRPRRFDPSIPGHIDQTAIPAGAYWSKQDRVWFTIIIEGERQKRRKLAGADAKLSDLHRILEEFAGVQRDTLGWLCDLFHESTKYKALAATTQTDYEAQRALIRSFNTKAGTLGNLRLSSISGPFIQRIVDKIAVKHPSKAIHLLRYLRRVFNWAKPRGWCHSNPAEGLDAPIERKRRRLPEPVVHSAVLVYAREHAVGYLWIAMELAYLLRLRSIEVRTLTDASEEPDGIQTNRRKGSRDSVVLWSPRLRAAWSAALEWRAAVNERTRQPVPILPEHRLLLVNQNGEKISKEALSNVWQTMILAAIRDGIIRPDQRFGMHDLKRRGVTDTNGNRADKRDASGHKTDAMMDVYDLSIPRVPTPGGV